VARDSIARALRVGTLVVGSVEPERDSIWVTARLCDDAGVELDRVTVKKQARDLIALSDSLSDEVALLIRKRLGRAIELDRTRTVARNTDAWERYQRALLARDKGDSLFKAGNAAGSTHLYLVADSFAALAERLDPQWPDPSVLRGALDLRRTRHAPQDRGLAGHMIDSGLAHAERALRLNPKSADAIELRGTLKYWRWLIAPELDATKRDKLLADAQSDLEDATRLNPAQASAYASLSHLYNNAPGKTKVDVAYAANKALEMDAYLDNAAVIFRRLILADYDGGQFAEANKRCQEGGRRFPENPDFVECELLMLTTDFRSPDAARAWALADSMALLTKDSSDRRYTQLYGRVLVAAVLARAQQTDSARSLLHHTKGNSEIDPTADLALIAAFAWTLVGDNTEALNQLRSYLTVNPSYRASLRDDEGWWFRRLAEDPRFNDLIVTPQ
jgi:serine/threonine-protein kinase